VAKDTVLGTVATSPSTAATASPVPSSHIGFQRPKHVSTITGKKVQYPLAKGQIWKTDRQYLHILHLGKRLVEYRILKRLDQRMMSTQMSAIRDFENYLTSNAAKLHNAGD
jgi:hypothetical protein